MSRGRTAAAALTSLGLVLGASPGVARAAEWTSARTTAVNYQPTQTTARAEVLAELNRMRSESQSCGEEGDFAAAGYQYQ
jgi:hypothetical protein